MRSPRRPNGPRPGARNIPVFSDLPVPADTANLREGATCPMRCSRCSRWSGCGAAKAKATPPTPTTGSASRSWFARRRRLSALGITVLAPDRSASSSGRTCGSAGSGVSRRSRGPSEFRPSSCCSRIPGVVELYYGRPLTQSSWELVTDAVIRSKPACVVGGAKRLYGIVEGGDLAYVEERVLADGGLMPHLSARLSRFVG